jgi:hypothetical protein
MFPLMMADRQCGDCHECCVQPCIIDEKFEKLPFTPCKHLNDKGCGIYTDPGRPKTCAHYKCLWLAGMIPGDERRRPDKLGVIFQSTPLVEVVECRPGALDSPQVRYLTDWLSNRLKTRSVTVPYQPHRKEEIFQRAILHLMLSA